MLQIVCYVIFLIIDLLVFVPLSVKLLSAEPLLQGYVALVTLLGGVSVVIFASWGGSLIGIIKDQIKDQLNDMHSIRLFKKEKEHHENALAKYKEEFQEKLSEDYMKFEKALMDSVKDSKLIATVLQESKYANVLDRYHTTVKNTIIEIRKCDTAIENCIKNMLRRQENTLFGYGRFIPQNMRYVIKEED